MNRTEVSDRELDHLIDRWSDKYYRHSGSNTPIVSALRDLKIERAKALRLEAMVEALDENLRDERQAHVAEVARLNSLLRDDLRSTPYIEVKHWK